jgi:hypothetical protein
MKLLNPREYFRDHFSARIFLTLSLVIIIGTFSFTVFFYSYQRASLTEKVKDKGELLASLLAHNAKIGIFADNSDLLTAPISDILQDPQVLSVVIYASDGRILALQNRTGSKPLPDAEKWDAGVANALTDALPVVSLNSDNFIFWTRVTLKPLVAVDNLYLGGGHAKDTKKTIGFIKVVLDSNFLRKSLRSLLLACILNGVALLLIGSLIAYHLSKKITTPLNKLTEEVNSFGSEGKYKEIAVENGDEIGKLAAAFNNLVVSLQKRETEQALLEEQLRQSQKMEAVGQLAGGVAHDFNNILTAIYGHCSVLQMKMGTDAPFRRDIDQIYAAAERAANLTRSLLAFSRKQIMNPKKINLNEIVMNVGKMLTRIIGEDIQLKAVCTGKPLRVFADSGQIEQVLMNLAANARDAMTKGGILTIETAVQEIDESFIHAYGYGEAGKYVVLSVSDTGKGMDAETSKKIFEPFFTTKEVGKGTGLGLSIVYGVIKQHNGYINVYSKPEEGTTFRIYLPQVYEEDVDSEKETPPEYPRMGSETILVAEDDATIRELEGSILREFGYDVILACDGEDAVEKFKAGKEKIAIIVMDMIMPRKSGKEAYEEIKKIQPDVRILFMSGYSPDLLHDRGISANGEDVLIKPIHPLELVRKLRAVLDS